MSAGHSKWLRNRRWRGLVWFPSFRWSGFGGLKHCPHLYQREAEQFEALPRGRFLRIRMVRCKTNAPDPVIGTRLDQETFAGSQQELPQAGILRELREV